MAKQDDWPMQFDTLAVYNAEVNRGIVHTESWQMAMSKLQAEYRVWLTEYFRKQDEVRARNKR